MTKVESHKIGLQMFAIFPFYLSFLFVFRTFKINVNVDVRRYQKYISIKKKKLKKNNNKSENAVIFYVQLPTLIHRLIFSIVYTQNLCRSLKK